MDDVSSPLPFRLPLRTPTLPPATHTNCYFVQAAGHFLCVEPATPDPDEQDSLFQNLRAYLARGLICDGVFLTHHHVDHVQAAWRVREELGVPVCAHPETAARVARFGPVDVLVQPDQRLLDGSVQALHTPGHAPGHLCLHHAQASWLIAGDMVASEGTILIDPSDDGDMGEYLRQLERLRALGVRVVLPAHGAPVETPWALFTRYLEHRRARGERVRAALAAAGPDGADLTELSREAYSDTPAAPAFLAERSSLAYLHDLAKGGRAIEHLGRWRPT